MKKSVIKAIVKGIIIAFVFIGSLYFISSIMNKDSIEMTMEMGSATYPVVSMLVEGERVNYLHGYQDSMENGLIRDTLTPLQTGRKINFTVDKYGAGILGMSYEVRSIDGGRLIESTDILEYQETKTQISAAVTLKDLIDANQEYMFVLKLREDENNIISYYTRILQGDNLSTVEKIDYILDFHKRTFDKDAARELVKYLESNSEGDNTTFSKVNINSSFSQVTWGDLDITKDTSPKIWIRELNEQTGSFLLRYQVSIKEGTKTIRYKVNEYYRIRYTSDRIYLLDYERNMEQIFERNASDIINNKIILGIANENVPIMESDGGNVFAFVYNQSLYSYNITDNKLAMLFSFVNTDNDDERCIYDGHEIKILNVDEGLNVNFLLY